MSFSSSVSVCTPQWVNVWLDSALPTLTCNVSNNFTHTNEGKRRQGTRQSHFLIPSSPLIQLISICTPQHFHWLQHGRSPHLYCQHRQRPWVRRFAGPAFGPHSRRPLGDQDHLWAHRKEIVTPSKTKSSTLRGRTPPSNVILLKMIGKKILIDRTRLQSTSLCRPSLFPKGDFALSISWRFWIFFVFYNN
jgi:hypothetical protein